MPDESCRICGGVLEDFAKCTQCNKVNRMICKKCGTKTNEQFHAICMLTFQTNIKIRSKIESKNHPLITVT